MTLALDTPLQMTVGRNYPRAPQPAGLELPLKDHQLAMLQRCFDIEKAAVMSPYRMGFMADPVSGGKCMSKGTKVLMYSGEVKNVEDIGVGELIMGDDSTPRKVLELGRGQDEMYEITPKRGSPYTVNSEHILCLQATRNGSITKSSQSGLPCLTYWDVAGQHHRLSFSTEQEAREAFLAVGGDGVSCMTVKQLLAKKPWERRYFKAYRKAVEFNCQPIHLDPYILGVWLGNGTCNSSQVTNVDADVIDALRGYADVNCLKFTQLKDTITWSLTGEDNPFVKALREYNIYNDKRIPGLYLANDKKVRLEVLAGLLDTDGHLEKDKSTGYEIVQKRKGLADDIVFLARSLGFAAQVRSMYEGIYHVYISGDGLHEIPTRIERKKASYRKRRTDSIRYGFDIRPVGWGDYYGFEIDGNKRFMLGDMTVTHNTAVSLCMALVEKNTLRKRALNIVVVPQNICMQWMSEIKKFTGNMLKVMLLIDYSSISELTFQPSAISKYDIVLTTPMYFSTLADFCEKGHVTPRRVVIDEADTIANMVSKKIPGTMTWFVSATMDRLPESRQGMVQVGKEVTAIEERQTQPNMLSALTTKRGGTLRAQETGTYEIPTRLVRSGERICRCDPAWVNESFNIPPPVKKIVVVSNVIMDVLSQLTFARMLLPQQLESANARDFRNLRIGSDDEFEILPALLKRYGERKHDAEVTLKGLENTMHMEQRINECNAEVMRLY